MAELSSILVEARELRIYYGSERRPLRAVDGVDLSLERGRSVGLVGESGCGKSTLGRAILRLEKLTAGRVLYEGQDIGVLRGAALKAFRRKAQMIFQDPFGSLNPRMAVGRALEEVLQIHGQGGRRECREKAAGLFESVGLDPDYLSRYPHEFSGGQRQRIGIARALAVGPELIVADEPVSALDVSVQVQILNLLKDLRQNLRLTYLFVAHDLAVVRYVCDRIVVMYLGRVVEEASADALYRRPAHPYTEALLASVPDVEKGLKGRAAGKGPPALSGDVPSAIKVIPGCPFHPRCPRVQARCKTERPTLTEAVPGHRSACHFARELLGLNTN